MFLLQCIFLLSLIDLEFLTMTCHFLVLKQQACHSSLASWFVATGTFLHWSARTRWWSSEATMIFLWVGTDLWPPCVFATFALEFCHILVLCCINFNKYLKWQFAPVPQTPSGKGHPQKAFWLKCSADSTNVQVLLLGNWFSWVLVQITLCYLHVSEALSRD